MYRIIMMLVIYSISVAGCSSSKKKGNTESGDKIGWKQTEINVDGNYDDWSFISFEENKASKIKFSLINDSSFLFICMYSEDGATQLKMSRSGLQVNFNNGPEKYEKYELFFELVQPQKSLGSQEPIPRTLDPKSGLKSMVLNSKKYITLNGFGNANGKYGLEVPNDAGIKASMAVNDKGFLFYELSIPLKAIDAHMDKGKLTFGISVNGLTMPSQGGGMAGGPGGGMGGGMPRGGMSAPPGGGGGMPPGGSMGGPGGGQPNVQDLSKNIKFWKTFILADHLTK